MDLVKSFVPGRLDLSDLLKAFFLDLGPFLRALRRAKAIATGVQVALFMAGALKRSVREHPRALVLDVLCHTARARDILVGMLEAAGYYSRGVPCVVMIWESGPRYLERREFAWFKGTFQRGLCT